MRGGFDLPSSIKDSEFKYTTSPGRKEWVKNSYPIGEYLISCIGNIPWNTYEYTGEARLYFPVDDPFGVAEERAAAGLAAARVAAAGAGLSEVERRALENGYTSKLVRISTHRYRDTDNPYYFFGGCVYEILNRVIPATNLRNFVDPTGDIDVIVNLPYIEVSPDTDTDYLGYLLENGRMNGLLDNYTRWLLIQLKLQLQSIPILDRLFENAVQFDLAEVGDEGRYDIRLHLLDRRVWFVRLPVYDRPQKTIKLQIIAKFEGTPEDHLIELVLPLISEISPIYSDRLNYNYPGFTESFNMVGGFPLQRFTDLIQDNVKAMYERMGLSTEPEFRHKFYNHVGRLQFLNAFAGSPALYGILDKIEFQPRTYRGSTTSGLTRKREFIGRIYYLMDTILRIRDEGNLMRLYHRDSADNTEVGMINSLALHLKPILRDKRGDFIPPNDYLKVPRRLSNDEIIRKIGGKRKPKSRKSKKMRRRRRTLKK